MERHVPRDLFLESVLAIPISQTEKLKKGSFL